MYQDRVVLCGSNAYEKKYYLNDDFRGLPAEVQKELKIMCVLFTEKVGGVLTVEFGEDGELELHTTASAAASRCAACRMNIGTCWKPLRCM